MVTISRRLGARISDLFDLPPLSDLSSAESDTASNGTPSENPGARETGTPE
jgi:hypothetical protein